MDSLNLSMMDLAQAERVRLHVHRDDAQVADLCDTLLMGGEIGWQAPTRVTHINTAAGWAPVRPGELDALAGLAGVRARLWGPWYGQRPTVRRLRPRDALGAVIARAMGN